MDSALDTGTYFLFYLKAPWQQKRKIQNQSGLHIVISTLKIEQKATC